MPGAAATAAAAASGVQSRLSMFECRPPAGVAASATARRFGSGGGGGGGGGSRSWYFGTDISDAPEGAIAVRLTPHADAAAAAASSTGASTAAAPGASTERRAQSTVWDHVRSERRSVGADPALEAEAKRLMAAAAGREKKRLCFARDSIIAETFEYQSEQSLMAELKITPDYPVEPFEPPVVVVTAATVASAARLWKPDAPRTAPDCSRSTAAPAAAPASPAAAAATTPAAPAPVPSAADIGSYKAKLATDVFVWGARGPQTANATAAAAVAAMNGGAGNEQQPQQQQQQKQQWSVSTTADLLF